MPDKAIWVSTLYGRDNKIPMVQIEVPGGKAQLDIESADQVARHIMEACQASLTDAFLIEWLKAADFDEATVFGLLREFRQWREARIVQPPKEVVGDA